MSSTYHQAFGIHATCIDDRTNIGPHHLSIGKTRKLFEWRGVVHAFFSQGYQIAHARVDADTLQVRDVRVLDELPVGWGGGAFCIDCDRAGLVTLVFLHRNQRELAVRQGRILDGDIAWQGWRPLVQGASRLAAPWVEADSDGTAWCSVLSRDGAFQLAAVAQDGACKVGALFEPGERPWYHSCVQMLPVGGGQALAVGFRGTFPNETELVFRPVSADLRLGEVRALGRCNVNDALTFHFQAVGDPDRGRAHIVYLDDGLAVSHAVYENQAWTITRNVFARASFAPQLCLDAAGALALLTVDYDGRIWTAAWTPQGWREPQSCDLLPRVNISPAFGRTGYGTGGLISAARAPSGRVPFLMATMEDDRSARARLHLSVLGARSGLVLASRPVSVAVDGRRVHACVALSELRQADCEASDRCWVVVVPGAGDASLKIAIFAKAGGLTAEFVWCGPGRFERDECRSTIEVKLDGPFSRSAAGAMIEVTASLSRSLSALNPKAAWVETYAGQWSPEACSAALIDIGPFEPEPAASATLDPASIAKLFRRLV